jgi:hypothetical protein
MERLKWAAEVKDFASWVNQEANTTEVSSFLRLNLGVFRVHGAIFIRVSFHRKDKYPTFSANWRDARKQCDNYRRSWRDVLARAAMVRPRAHRATPRRALTRTIKRGISIVTGDGSLLRR